ncbi:MAG: GNAT family N-acetyltransferase [Firmicutes bacterium]|nr:GNAT family N-acetyltransferase [Bacillota bacterium]
MNEEVVTLRPARREEIPKIWQMQLEAFAKLLEKYQDYDTSPAAEPMEKIIKRFEMEGSIYYLIMVGTEEVGVIRIVDKKDGSRKRISPLWIMPAYRGKGYAQLAMIEAERIHGSDHWSLDTILQEKGNLHLYEKMGYHQTGKIEKINEKMDIVFYEKDQ